MKRLLVLARNEMGLPAKPAGKPKEQHRVINKAVEKCIRTMLKARRILKP